GQPRDIPCGGRATEFGRGASRLPAETQLRIPQDGPRESERGGEASRSKGKQPRPPTKAPKSTLSGKGSGIAVTAGMLAQKQPSFQKCVTAYRSSHPAPKMTGTKRRAAVADRSDSMVGERCPPPRSRTDKDRWSAGKCECRNE